MLLITAFNSNAATVDSIHKALFKTDDVSLKVDLYLALSREYQSVNTDSAEYCLQQALNLAKNLKLFLPLGKVYHSMGNFAVIQNRLVNALHDYRLASQFFRRAGQQQQQVAKIYLLLGNIFYMQDNIPEAMNNYLEGINLGEELQLKRLLGHLYNNMGIIYQESDDKETCLDYLLKSQKNFSEVGDSVEIGNPILNIGIVYCDLGNYEMAMNYTQKAINIYLKADEQLRAAEAKQWLGIIESKQGLYNEALSHLNESLVMMYETDKKFRGPKNYSLADLYVRMGGVFVEVAKYEKARFYLKKGYDLAKYQNQPKVMLMASENLSRVYENIKKYDSALFYYKIFHEKTDSLSKAISITTFKLTEIRRGFEKKEKENELKLSFEKSKRKTIIIIYIISGVILIALILILFLLLKLEKQKKKQSELEKANLDEKLEFQNKEMTTNVMYLNKMNEQVVQIAEKLRNLQIDEGTHNAKIIRSIISELQQGSGSDSMKKFEIRFQKVHKDFYKNLLDKCPELTPNELKLCAFLRLNMSTKDISSLTYQSENSLMVARTRLRQKLGIQRQENLITFLAQF
ncbi:MAG: tetratricopeptide repeat protein [Bacteroidota bacterium]